MSFFFIAAALLVIAVLAALLAPLLGWGGKADAATTRGDYDLAIYRDQLSEIERDQERGLFTAEEAEAARIEIQRRMLAAAESRSAETPAAVAQSVGAARRLALAVLVVMPIAAGGLYGILGTPGAGDQPLSQRQTAQSGADQTDMAAMAQQLRTRLQENPNDLEGWLLLGRSYGVMGQLDNAAMAYSQGAVLSGRRPDILAAWGEVLIWQSSDRVTPQAQALFREAVEKDPDEPRSRYYLAMARLQAGDAAGAVQDWTELVKQSPPDAPWLATVNEQIRRANASMGTGTGGAPVISVAPRGPSQSDVEAASQMSADDRNTMIRSMVERLADRMKENPGDREGWLRLGRAYEVLGEKAKSEEALAKARALEGK